MINFKKYLMYLLFILIFLMIHQISALAVSEPPSITITNPDSGDVFVKGKNITISASAVGSPSIAAMGLYVDGTQKDRVSGNKLSYSWPSGNVSAGKHSIRITAWDGTRASEETVVITIKDPSEMPPEITVKSPDSGDTFSQGAKIKISASATANPKVAAMALYIDNKQIIRPENGSLSYTWDTRGVAVGKHTIKISAVNPKNVSDYETVKITIKDPADVPPEITLKNPKNNNSFAQGTKIDISASATTNPKVAAMALYIDNKQIIRPESGSLSYTWDTRGVAVGKHVIKINAVNPKNISSSETIKVTITDPAEAPPQIIVSSLTEGQTIPQGNKVNIIASATAALPIQAMALYFDGSSTPAVRPTAASLNYTWDTSRLSIGEHTIKVTATTAKKSNQYTFKVLIAAPVFKEQELPVTNSGNGQYSTSWPTSNLAPGTYIIEMQGYSDDGEQVATDQVQIKIN
ncbi:MAG: hypothetical protein GX660_26905 [Clostridiaceae bacterium]|nr:hypothetical protein [Clostridiaceae bacterium]